MEPKHKILRSDDDPQRVGLVLGRQLDESLIFVVAGISFKVKVVRLRNDNVRLGINAPDTVKVYREEIYDPVTKSEKK